MLFRLVAVRKILIFPCGRALAWRNGIRFTSCLPVADSGLLVLLWDESGKACQLSDSNNIEQAEFVTVLWLMGHLWLLKRRECSSALALVTTKVGTGAVVGAMDLRTEIDFDSEVVNRYS